MSYDLMVFEAKKAPEEKEAFMQWYEELVKWGEDYSYDDVSICCKELQSWYHEMRQRFPAMNGPDATSDEEFDDDDGSISDYCIARDAIYVAFSWSQAEEAYPLVRTLAKKHGVGFFDVSGSDSDIILPDVPAASSAINKIKQRLINSIEKIPVKKNML